MTARPTWDEYFNSMARVAASRSTCPRASCGAVIVSRDNRVLSTGYNGSVPGGAHCDTEGCLVADGHCQRAIHAEVNAIAHAASAGVALRDARIYLWSDKYTTPCRECLKVIKAAGINKVVSGGLIVEES